MALKGQESKVVITDAIMKLFPKSFLVDKILRIPMIEKRMAGTQTQ